MLILFFALAMFLGCSVVLQGTINTSLAEKIGTGGTLVINTVMVLMGCLIAYAVMADSTKLSLANLSKASWYEYSGGLFGFCIVLLAIILFPRLGAGVTLVLAIGAQLILAMVIDHYGFMGIPQQAISMTRLLGAGLVVTGAALIKFF